MAESSSNLEVKNEPYSNREIDRMLKEIMEYLDRIEKQTTKTNGRVTRLEKLGLIIGVAIIVGVFLKAPQLFGLIKLLI